MSYSFLGMWGKDKEKTWSEVLMLWLLSEAAELPILASDSASWLRGWRPPLPTWIRFSTYLGFLVLNASNLACFRTEIHLCLLVYFFTLFVVIRSFWRIFRGVCSEKVTWLGQKPRLWLNCESYFSMGLSLLLWQWLVSVSLPRTQARLSL